MLKKLLNSETLTLIADETSRIRTNIGKVLVGKEDQVEIILAAILSSGHVLVEDVPGIGKTILARSIANSLDCTFKRIQCTPDLLPSDITGIHYYDQRTGTFEFRPGPIISQIVLADEINRATPRTQSALLEAMGEHQITVDDTTIQLPSPFLVLATQNPIELEGTFPLPEAQLDRFLIRLQLGYPGEEEEEEILSRFQSEDPINTLTAVTSANQISYFQAMVTQIYVDPVLRNYIVRLARATRDHPDINLGVSPRATLGLYRCCQSLAAIRAREYVTPDEIKLLAPYTFSHRMILKSQARLRDRNPQEIITEILDKIEVPI